MNKDKVFDFYEKIYFKELDEMNIILSRFPILIAGTALIINAYIFLFKFEHFEQLNIYLKGVFIGLIILTIGGLLFCLFKTFQTNLYDTVGSLEQLDVKKKEYQEYEISVKNRNLEADDCYQQKVEAADDLFQEDIQNKFIKCSDINRKLNNKRRGWFHNSIFIIWINLALCITIPIIVIIITMWSSSMSEEKKNPPPIPKPAETETTSVRNVVPANESFSTDYSENSPTPPKEGDKDK